MVKARKEDWCLFWDESINISISSYGMHHIDTFIWDNDNHTSWHGTFVYGEACIQD
jgi:hypothetical protein